MPDQIVVIVITVIGLSIAYSIISRVFFKGKKLIRKLKRFIRQLKKLAIWIFRIWSGGM